MSKQNCILKITEIVLKSTGHATFIHAPKEKLKNKLLCFGAFNCIERSTASNWQRLFFCKILFTK